MVSFWCWGLGVWGLANVNSASGVGGDMSGGWGVCLLCA